MPAHVAMPRPQQTCQPRGFCRSNQNELVAHGASATRTRWTGQPNDAVHSCACACVSSVVFPPTFPVIEKTIRMDLDMNSLQAVNLISEKSRCDCSDCYLFLPAAKRVVGDEELLMDLEEWANEVRWRASRWRATFACSLTPFLLVVLCRACAQEYVELRSKHLSYDKKGGGCCTIC